jgi:hypothetical protein
LTQSPLRITSIEQTPVVGPDVTSTVVGQSDAHHDNNEKAGAGYRRTRKSLQEKYLSVLARIFRLLNSILTRPSKNNRKHITRAYEAQGLGRQDG